MRQNTLLKVNEAVPSTKNS